MNSRVNRHSIDSNFFTGAKIPRTGEFSEVGFKVERSLKFSIFREQTFEN
jgi:hypothetical protein